MQYQLLRGKSKQKANIKLTVGNQLIFSKLQKNHYLCTRKQIRTSLMIKTSSMLVNRNYNYE